ncbi:LeuD1 [Desulfamplus magnetovallimortis]|uniref:3-isopropylmalate dehydratase n=1 Tax=Desulfamplus magnetovallimortis TaxID=1246637 RepID=A0A1W1HKM9_9BACT|nr:3-isopropylmalate dehydratase [Desulfamplus magnetovallimortis]SLM33067.1 LeuD1 [Desulfamplus magnetovallimortis]
MKYFSGKILFLDRSDINTDEIIPAKYLTENTKDALKPYLLEDLVLKGFDASRDIKEKSVVITRDNFGCGSSREHAPWAFEVNGINLVIASGFARIFRQNMFNCGMMAVEMSPETIDSIFDTFSHSETSLETDMEKMTFTIKSEKDSQTIPFSISDFDISLVKAGGWVDFADQNY